MSIQKLSQGYLRTFLMRGAEQVISPVGNKAWLILYGTGYHLTGTITQCYVSGVPSQTFGITEQLYSLLASIAIGTANAYFNLFSLSQDLAATDKHLTSWQPIIVKGDKSIVFKGDASATLNITVLEFDI